MYKSESANAELYLYVRSTENIDHSKTLIDFDVIVNWINN